ncbi:hypothetical protein [Halopseudomonas salina]|uniref:Lipoprotein n=1 Tax=Halopseudomonas salina TaxID=1323744 RepID=A0ABQ1Q3Z0_9GAMM|nr:hypothetical protein [Halopseudomonas salina]GGD12830.1 hypothetical protein GCM10007418_34610 [Halopseudomonas salina]
MDYRVVRVVCSKANLGLCAIFFIVFSIGCSPAEESTSPKPPSNLAANTTEDSKHTNPFTIGYGQEYPIAPLNEDDFPLPLALKGFKAPMPSDAGLSMFFDQEIVLLAETSLIYSVQTSRAYADLEACNFDRDLAQKVVLARIPGLAGETPQFESESFVVDLYCGYSKGGRFVELHLAIFHKPTQEKIAVPDYSDFRKNN